MKRHIFMLFFVVIFVLVIQNQVEAGTWLNVDLSNSKTWVDTSHWEPYQAWVDTSHWEWRPYNVWVNSGYWADRSYWTGEYWLSNYQGVDTIAWGGDTPPWSQWGYAFFKLPSYFVNRLWATNDRRAISYRNDRTSWAGAHGPNEGYRYNKIIDVLYDYSSDYLYPRILRRPWNLWIEERGPWYNKDLYLYAESYGYYRKDLIRNVVWIDTSHWETRWGWQWVNSGYYETRYRWVTSGYWDEAHGQVSVSKSPPYVFTAAHQMKDGQPAYMDLSIQWRFNKKVTKIEAYHDLVRFGDKGTMRVYGTQQLQNGLNSTAGQGIYRFTYPKPGTANSKLYIQFTFDNNTSFGMWAYIPVNGFTSTMKDKQSQPIWDKSLLDAESVSF